MLLAPVEATQKEMGPRHSSFRAWPYRSLMAPSAAGFRLPPLPYCAVYMSRARSPLRARSWPYRALIFLDFVITLDRSRCRSQVRDSFYPSAWDQFLLAEKKWISIPRKSRALKKTSKSSIWLTEGSVSVASSGRAMPTQKQCRSAIPIQFRRYNLWESEKVAEGSADLGVWLLLKLK